MKKHQNVTQWQRSFLVAVLFIIPILSCVSTRAQSTQIADKNAKAKLDNKIPKHIPLKIEFENAETEDLLRTIKVKVTNVSAKPIYFLLFDFVPLDVISPEGLKYSFRLTYGRYELKKLTALPLPDDKPLLPGESHVFTVDAKVLDGWDKKRDKDKSPKPKHFDFRIQHLGHGDGSGYLGRTGAPFSGRIKQNSDGTMRKNVLMKESEFKLKNYQTPKRTATRFDVSFSLTKETEKINKCQSSNSSRVAAFLTDAGKTLLSNLSDTFDVFTIKASAATVDCGCPSGCNFWQDTTVGCCPYGADGGEATNTFIPTYEYANCSDPDGYCSTPENYSEPFYCEGGGPTTGNGCNSSYLVYCETPCGSSEICGNAVDDNCNGLIDEYCGGGGGGGGCTPYYWVYYLSYDGGRTWEMVDFTYAGCW